MKQTQPKIAVQSTIDNHQNSHNEIVPIGGLLIRTDLCAGLSWDDLNGQAQELWGNLASTLNDPAGRTEICN